MRQQRKEFIQDFFRYIRKEKYLLLKFIESSLEEIELESDLDILYPSADLSQILEFVQQHPNIFDFNLLRQHQMAQVFIHFKDGGFLQIDFLFQLVRKDLVYLTNREVFSVQRIVDGVKTYEPKLLLTHLLLFNFLNYSGLSTKYINYFNALPSNQRIDLIRYINQRFNTTFQSFEEMAIYTAKIRNKLVKQVKKNGENTIFQRVKHYARYIKSASHSLRNVRGIIISFSGVDGAGKSTILTDVEMALKRKYRQHVVRLRHRPSILPILSAWRYGKAEAEQRSVERLPREGTNKSTIGSLIRFMYYYMDYLLGQVVIFFKYTIRGYTVLYDRYYFDFIVDGKRSNIQLGTNLPKWLYHFVQKPDLNIFLYAEPEVILARKQELTAETINELTTNYKNLFHNLENNFKQTYLPIENVDRKTTVETILQHYRAVM